MQSGISASQELHTAFQTLIRSTSLGFLAGIEKESIVPHQSLEITSSFSDALFELAGLLTDKDPAYIILRRHSGDAPFVAVTYVPDTANVRQKMLFASTRNTLVRELGSEKFAETIFATTKEELTLEGFKRHDAHGEKPAPLTEEEETMKKVREAEAEESRGTLARKSHVSSGVSFPLSQEAVDALRTLPANGFLSLIQLAIDTERETIELASATSTAIADFTHVIPDDAPRYSFFVFRHEYEGQQQAPLVFIYTCPPQSKIKERMLYASCRSGVVETAENEAGIRVEKKLEAATADEVGEAQLLEEFHPKKDVKSAFQRPKRPGRR